MINQKIKSIEAYIREHKTFLLSDFSDKDITQISTMSEGFFIVNNCKIPVLNGSLLMNQWITRNNRQPKREKLTTEEINEHKKLSHKRYVDKQKLIKSGLMDIEDKPISEITFTSMTSIFRDYQKSKSNTVKRIITAKHEDKISLYIPDMFFSECFFRPMIQKVSNNNALSDINKMSNRVYVTMCDKYNKHYVPMELTLKSNNGQSFRYNDKNILELIE